MKYFDVNNDGNLSYEEFVKCLREPLNERRQHLVEKVFSALDKNHSGKLELAEVTSTFQGQKGETVEQFLSNFESAQKSGWISKQDFFDFYTDLGMTFTHDEQFVHFVESTWGLNENEEAAVF